METQAIRMPLSQLSERLGLNNHIQRHLATLAEDSEHAVEFTLPKGKQNPVGIIISDPDGKIPQMRDTIDLEGKNNSGVTLAIRTLNLSNEFLRAKFGQLKTEGSTLA